MGLSDELELDLASTVNWVLNPKPPRPSKSSGGLPQSSIGGAAHKLRVPMLSMSSRRSPTPRGLGFRVSCPGFRTSLTHYA